MGAMNHTVSLAVCVLLTVGSAVLPGTERAITLHVVGSQTWEHSRHQGLRLAGAGEVTITSLWPAVDHVLHPISAPTNPWPALREHLVPQVIASSLLQPAQPLSLHIDGWEDGLTVSRDGLHLYAIYAPGDLLGYTLDGYPFEQMADYLRGPTLGMDLDATVVIGVNTWLHGDILRSSRASPTDPFPPWTLSNLAFPVTSEGAPAMTGATDDGWEWMVYTSNQTPPHHAARIWLVAEQDHALSAPGSPLPEPVNPPAHEPWQTDNPHLEQVDDGSLVLFFDSNRPGGPSDELDIWYSRSTDDGSTWSEPAPVTTVNTPATDHQPHLWRDEHGQWWLWWSATNPDDGRLAIYRARQVTPGDWDDWSARELVVSAGTAVGIGEPTLTDVGDLFFIVVIEDPNPGPAGRFMADPWWAPAQPSPGGASGDG